MHLINLIVNCLYRKYEILLQNGPEVHAASNTSTILLVIRFMADLLRKYRGSVVIMVGRSGAEPHYVHN